MEQRLENSDPILREAIYYQSKHNKLRGLVSQAILKLKKIQDEEDDIVASSFVNVLQTILDIDDDDSDIVIKDSGVKRIAVLAGNYAEFLDWCKINRMNPNDSNVIYVSRYETLLGLSNLE
jgi:hypothetical protein